MNIKNPLRTGDIILAELNGHGSVQQGCRPCLVISSESCLKHSNILQVIPMSSILKKVGQPTHTVYEATPETGLKTDSMLLGEQQRVIDKAQIVKHLGHANQKQLHMAAKIILENTPIVMMALQA